MRVRRIPYYRDEKALVSRVSKHAAEEVSVFDIERTCHKASLRAQLFFIEVDDGLMMLLRRSDDKPWFHIECVWVDEHGYVNSGHTVFNIINGGNSSETPSARVMVNRFSGADVTQPARTLFNVLNRHLDDSQTNLYEEGVIDIDDEIVHAIAQEFRASGNDKATDLSFSDVIIGRGLNLEELDCTPYSFIPIKRRRVGRLSDERARRWFKTSASILCWRFVKRHFEASLVKLALKVLPGGWWRVYAALNHLRWLDHVGGAHAIEKVRRYPVSISLLWRLRLDGEKARHVIDSQGDGMSDDIFWGLILNTRALFGIPEQRFRLPRRVRANLSRMSAQMSLDFRFQTGSTVKSSGKATRDELEDDGLVALLSCAMLPDALLPLKGWQRSVLLSYTFRDENGFPFPRIKMYGALVRGFVDMMEDARQGASMTYDFISDVIRRHGGISEEVSWNRLFPSVYRSRGARGREMTLLRDYISLVVNIVHSIIAHKNPDKTGMENLNAARATVERIVARAARGEIARCERRYHLVSHEIDALLAGEEETDWYPVVGDEIEHARELNTVHALNREARQMRHCVASYASLCASYDSVIFSITKDGSRSTVEFGMRGDKVFVRQHYGERNSPAPAGHKSVVKALERRLTEKLGLWKEYRKMTRVVFTSVLETRMLNNRYDIDSIRMLLTRHPHVLPGNLRNWMAKRL